MNTQQAPVKTGMLDFLRMSSGNQLVIPVYQRNYTWIANKEVKQYFEDLTYVVNGTYDKENDIIKEEVDGLANFFINIFDSKLRIVWN